jgi:hypothetical protein
MPTASLTAYVTDLESQPEESDRRTLAFIGASPLWGYAVSDERYTIPAALERYAESKGVGVRAHNLACNGQLLGDSYFIAKRVADDADLLVIQLTYHGFNGEWREGATQRFPELPTMLGVRVDPDLSQILGCEPSHSPDVTGSIDRWLAARWRLYGARDMSAAATFGSSPEKRLFERWEVLAQPDFAGDEEHVPSGQSFDSLDPDEQMLIIDEFAMAGEFEIDEDDSEVRMLARLSKELAASGMQAVFYISPLNTEALESFDLFDRELYAANVISLRAIVEGEGHTFVDFNEGEQIPSDAFADINHTTAEGNEIVAGKLWQAIQSQEQTDVADEVDAR